MNTYAIIKKIITYNHYSSPIRVLHHNEGVIIMTREQIIDKLIDQDIEFSNNESLYCIFLEGCTGYNQMSNGDLIKQYQEFIDEDFDPKCFEEK